MRLAFSTMFELIIYLGCLLFHADRIEIFVGFIKMEVSFFGGGGAVGVTKAHMFWIHPLQNPLK